MLTHAFETRRKPSRVVVVGGEGFVGKAVVERLRGEGAEVLSLGRREVDLLGNGAGERLAGRLREGDSVVLAAAIAPCKTAAMLRDNMILASAMIEAIDRARPAHIVNISSDAVYADLDQPLTETSWTAPGSLHGCMHLAREIMFRSEAKAPLAILRPTLIYGAADPHNGYGPNKFRRQANRGEDIVLFGEGEEERDHVCIDDVAEIVTRVLGHRSTGVLNIASGQVASFRALAETAVRLSGRPVAVRGSVRQGPMPHNGWRPFAIDACRAAFPDFRYVSVADGMAAAQAAEFS
ncbi:MAG: NAD-dependent epimerase/dehydratase family protein [Alphaproteobacteria bacterium]